MTIKVSDTFTDTDSTLLTSHTPDTDVVGTGWAGTASADIISNQLRFTADDVNVAIDGGNADGDVYIDWIVATSSLNRNSVLVRYTDDANHWRLNAREDNGDIRVVEVNAGAVNVRATSSYTFSEGSTYVIKANCSSTTITGYVDAVSQVSYASATFNQTETMHGLRRDTGSNNTRLDNFVIDDLAGGTIVISLAGNGGLAGPGGLAGTSGGLVE